MQFKFTIQPYQTETVEKQIFETDSPKTKRKVL